MKKLVVSAFMEKGKVHLVLDGQALEMGFPNEVELDDHGHVLQWYVESPLGGQFTISISSPKSAEMQLTKRLGKGEKDWGGVEV
jgi:hypothetical protein